MAGFDVSGSGGGAAAAASTPTIQALGALGATETINMASETWVWATGTLDANCAVTISNLAEGDIVELFLEQDGTGGRTLSVNGSSLAIPTTAGVAIRVSCLYDGTDLQVDVAGGGGIQETVVNAKGDILAATAADTVTRLAVGATNGMLLEAASGEATGLKYGHGLVPATYKTLIAASGRLDSATGSTILLFYGAGQVASAGIGNGAAGLSVFYLDPADYTIGALTNKYRVRASCLVNATAPAATLTVGLYPVTAVAGASNVVSITLDTVVTGSTVAFTTPAANSLNQGVTSDFTAPAAGWYAFGVALSGATAASSTEALSATLQLRQT